MCPLRMRRYTRFGPVPLVNMIELDGQRVRQFFQQRRILQESLRLRSYIGQAIPIGSDPLQYGFEL